MFRTTIAVSKDALDSSKMFSPGRPKCTSNLELTANDDVWSLESLGPVRLAKEMDGPEEGVAAVIGPGAVSPVVEFGSPVVGSKLEHCWSASLKNKDARSSISLNSLPCMEFRYPCPYGDAEQLLSPLSMFPDSSCRHTSSRNCHSRSGEYSGKYRKQPQSTASSREAGSQIGGIPWRERIGIWVVLETGRASVWNKQQSKRSATW